MDVIKSPLKAIKQYCYECSGESYAEVKRCSSADCPLKPFRQGKNPFRITHEMSAEQKEKAAERLSQARKARFGQNEEE